MWFWKLTREFHSFPPSHESKSQIHPKCPGHSSSPEYFSLSSNSAVKMGSTHALLPPKERKTNPNQKGTTPQSSLLRQEVFPSAEEQFPLRFHVSCSSKRAAGSPKSLTCLAVAWPGVLGSCEPHAAHVLPLPLPRPGEGNTQVTTSLH